MNSPAITELTLESGSLALWNEFLGGLFNGQSHAVGGEAAVAFPKAELRFQQSAQPQPLGGGTTLGAGISVVWVRPGKPRVVSDWVEGLAPNQNQRSRQQVGYLPGAFMFWVRAAGPADGTNNAKGLAMQVGELLFGVLGNSLASHGLAQKGITKLRPESPVLVSGDANYETRMVVCHCVLKYVVRSQS